MFLLLVLVSCETDPHAGKIIVGWGDSLMAGDLASNDILQVISDQREQTPYHNIGVGGIQSEVVGMLQGGIPFMIELESEVVPSQDSIPLLVSDMAKLKFLRLNKRHSGFINGHNGELVRLTPEGRPNIITGYTFKNNSNSKLSIRDFPVQFKFKNAIDYRNEMVLTWAGRNDPKTDDGIKKIRKNLDAMDEYLGPYAKDNYRIISICTGHGSKEGKGTRPYINVTNLNEELRKAFGDKFIELRKYLANEAIYDLQLTPTAEDLDDMEQDAIPRSLCVDQVHFNEKGIEATGK